MKARKVGLMFAIGVSLLFSSALCAQQVRQSPGQDSELTKENLGRVGASPNQIQAVLRQQPGLLVELKRWVAQEAASNGQVVKDSDLTDQKIFARLVSDTQFRSVATRLLERYGYLVPRLNPESDAAQERKLVLQARATQLAQEQNQQVQAQLPQANRLPWSALSASQRLPGERFSRDPNGTELRPEPRRPFARRLRARTRRRCKSVPRLARSSQQEIRTVAFSPQSNLRLGPIRRAAPTLPIAMKTMDLSPRECLPSPNGQLLTAASISPSQADTLSDPISAYRMNGAAPQCPSSNYPAPRTGQDQDNVYFGRDGSYPKR